MSSNIKNICCIGAGYVGGPTMAVIAQQCPNIIVNVVDLNEQRIAQWNDPSLDNLPIFEPGLKEIVSKTRNINLFFSSKIKECIYQADMIFISVNTPTKNKGIGAGQASDLKWIEGAARQIQKYGRSGTIVVEKSTLPVKTAKMITQILNDSFQSDPNKRFIVISNPEFLSEGTAIENLINPDRVLIGGEESDSIYSLKEIYLNWIEEDKIITTNLWSAELSKLTANAFLSQRISSINSISALCESTGANINEVAKAIGMDKRIGSKFLKAGPGFGGSCFKKDLLNLIYICNYYGLNEVAEYWEKVLSINEWQKKRISKIILEKMFGTLSNKKIAILGFAFKSNTNDTRESPSISICKDLIQEGCKINIYDPEVNKKNIEEALAFVNEDLEESSWDFSNSVYEAATNADAILILTEWSEFKNLNWYEISKIMRKPSWLFDTRSISNIKNAQSYGINIWEVGT
tara:strand:+ start:2778 stop:4163 length:1386 start_codon:yes stop_codon:yes gene_type:complete